MRWSVKLKWQFWISTQSAHRARRMVDLCLAVRSGGGRPSITSEKTQYSFKFLGPTVHIPHSCKQLTLPFLHQVAILTSWCFHIGKKRHQTARLSTSRRIPQRVSPVKYWNLKGYLPIMDYDLWWRLWSGRIDRKRCRTLFSCVTESTM